MEKIIDVEKTFYSKQEELSSVEEKLKRSKDFYVWLQKQYPKGEDYEAERQALLQVEYRLYWHCINEVIQASKADIKVNFVELSAAWHKPITKVVYQFIDWYKASVTKKGGLLQVDRATQEAVAENLATVLDKLADVDFYQKMYCYFQMHLNGIINFKEIAYPPKAKKSVKRKPDGDEPFLGERDMELFKSEDKQPVFWYCRDRRNVTLQQCIDEKLDLRLLCWPKNSDGHQDFTAVLPPLSYTKESKESVTWEHTYKGETLRNIEERLFPQPSFEEDADKDEQEENGGKKKERDVVDEVDLTFLNIQDGKDLLKG